MSGTEARLISHREVAKALYRERRQRQADLPELAGFWGDAAWDMLLDLFVAGEEGRMVDVKNACIGAQVAATTGLRLIDRLARGGLIARTSDPFDRRKSMLRLTSLGVMGMRRHFEQIRPALVA